MGRELLNFKMFLTMLFAFMVGYAIMTYGRLVVEEIGRYDRALSNRTHIIERAKAKPITVRGLYLTASSAASSKTRQRIIDLIKETELNSVIVDIKDYTGNILYDSDLALVNELDTERIVMRDVAGIVDEFHAADIYVIARQTVFQDPALAQAKSEWAITVQGGGLWRDYKGLSWVDPTRPEVWQYNFAIAREASKLGFDEINFDYVRFPSDGNIRTAVYANLNESKAETMRGFFSALDESLKRSRVYTSLDLFGLVLESGDFDLNIGQTLAVALDTVDYICPMTYPSHYPAGYLGLANPADHPYAVVSNGLKKAQATFADAERTQLRPWVQAFDLGAVYDGQKIRAQITAIEETDRTAGWMLWNASNNYTARGLLPDERSTALRYDVEM
ncbi:MAG: putative glycoside hydrolase [Patescibacteria group bacterium]